MGSIRASVSAQRAESFTLNLKGSYNFPEEILEVSSAGEDWDGLVRMLEDERPAYAAKALEVIGQAEREGATIVRLHTGDPCLYGAIREQMDALQKRGISFDLTPGVSSFCGAAAAAQAEYTLPGVSQTVIITRMAGRTPVPERENIASLAAHGATMVIFLSAGLLDGLQAELLKGAYTEQTSAALVYKATWPEEKVLRCPLGELAETGRRHGIRNTALVLVGDFLAAGYDRSRLYDPTFTTGFREASR